MPPPTHTHLILEAAFITRADGCHRDLGYFAPPEQTPETVFLSGSPPTRPIICRRDESGSECEAEVPRRRQRGLHSLAAINNVIAAERLLSNVTFNQHPSLGFDKHLWPEGPVRLWLPSTIKEPFLWKFSKDVESFAVKRERL